MSQVAKDLGINENQLYRWMQQAREAAGTGLPPFPGRPRDEELTRLRKEVKALREANEILKKAAELQFESSSLKKDSGEGVPVHAGEPGTIPHHGDDRTIRGQLPCLRPVGEERSIIVAGGGGRRTGSLTSPACALSEAGCI